MTAEMAMSPPPSRRKERTSVGLFLRRNRRLSCCRRRLPAIRMPTSPRTPARSWARRAKRSSPGRLAPPTAVSKMITFCGSKMGGPDRPPFGILLCLLLQGRLLLLSRLDGALGHLQRQLLGARALVIGADNALHQMVAHHVLFREEVEGEPLNVAQDVHGLQQSTPA